jgi:2-polyprenyl-3-methyl-5-hydroxy-6-metoxy-1,4-benzoquinol methylase
MHDIINKFSTKVIEKYPSHTKFLNDSLNNIDVNSLVQLKDYIDYCINRGLELDYLVDSYITITTDTQLEQIYFLQNKKYRWSKFEEVADKVYFDDEYMRKYMYGLALTSFLWPNHAAMHNFFVETFPQNATGTYLEIGPGHGYYFMQASKMGNFDKLLGIDISSTSLALTLDITNYFRTNEISEVELIRDDFLTFNGLGKTYSCIVMGEVLEHVESPERFLETIARISDAETHIYVTTCVNAPAVDHIYLFTNPSEIENLIEQSGLKVAEKLYASYGRLTLQQCAKQGLPINVAYVLKKSIN